MRPTSARVLGLRGADDLGGAVIAGAPDLADGTGAVIAGADWVEAVWRHEAIAEAVGGDVLGLGGERGRALRARRRRGLGARAVGR